MVTGPPNDENTNPKLCETVFLNGFDSCQGCDNSHDFDPVKLARGACVYELRRKDSCTKRDSCLYCHQIPSKCRNDKQLLAQAYEKKNAARRKDNSDNTDSREICPTEFYGGANTCKSRECNLKHKLDHRRISKGPCCYEFFKKGSCPHKSNCRFTHELPLECLSDPNARATVLLSIQKLQDKSKAAEVFGHEIVDEANHYRQTRSLNSAYEEVTSSAMNQYHPPLSTSNKTSTSGFLHPSTNNHSESTKENYARTLSPGQLLQPNSEINPQLLGMVQQPPFPPYQQNIYPPAQIQGSLPHSSSQESVPYLPANISSFLRHCVKEHLSKEPLYHPLNLLQQCR